VVCPRQGGVDDQQTAFTEADALEQRCDNTSAHAAKLLGCAKRSALIVDGRMRNRA
jgi:hypothetical protein